MPKTPRRTATHQAPEDDVRTPPKTHGPTVKIEYQIVTTVRDECDILFGAGRTIGTWVDQVVENHVQAGEQLGRMTLDLSDYTHDPSK